MMELILRIAKSVKLVFLSRFSALARHALGMAQVGEIFGRIVKSDDEPVLFLFNDYPEVAGEINGMNSEERQKYIEEAVVEEATDMIKEATEAENKYMRRVIEEYQNAGSDDPEELMRKDQGIMKVGVNRRYIHVMSKALSSGFERKGMLGYIDPSDDYSISVLKKALKELKPVSKEYFSFDGCTDQALHFRSYLGTLMELHSSVLRGEEIFQKYDCHIVSKALAIRKKERDELERDLERLKNAGEDSVKQYAKQYETDAIMEKADKLKEELRNCYNEKRIRDAKIKEIEEKPPVLYWSDSWNDTGTCVKEHVVRYPYGDDAPFDHYVQLLDGETRPVKVVSTNPKDFEIHYAPDVRAPKIASGLGAALGICLSVVSFGMALPLSVVCGGALGFALTRPNKGRVEFYVKPKNIPEVAEMMRKLKREAEEYSGKAAILEEEIKAMMESSKAELSQRVKKALDDDKKEVQALEQFLSFENNAHLLYLKRQEDIKHFHDVVEKFYPQQVFFSDFLSLHKRVTGGGIEPLTDEKQIPVTTLDPTILIDRYERLFPDIWCCQ